MDIIKKNKRIKKYISQIKQENKTIGFVPTMGNLHEGHLSLVREAKKSCDVVTVSIFVNPTQFGENEDFDKYPRTEKEDLEKLEALGVDVVFMPEPEEIYPHGFITDIDVPELSDKLCGASRPGHFKGVCTVVSKLLNIVMPDKLFIGQKDAQQSLIIQKLIANLNLNVQLVVLPIVREGDGLAMSSRNRYLSAKDRQSATIIYKALSGVKKLIEQKEVKSGIIIEKITEILTQVDNLKIDYIAVVDYNNLLPVEKIGDNILIAIAVYLGDTRLIDNVAFGQLNELKEKTRGKKDVANNV